MKIEDRRDLVSRFGDKSVENTMMYIVRSCDREGRAINILPDRHKILSILEIVHNIDPQPSMRDEVEFLFDLSVYNQDWEGYACAVRSACRRALRINEQ